MAASAISIICPHCGVAERDEFELLDMDEIHALTCASCHQRFHLMIFECERCGEETALTWSDVPTPDQIRGATCADCGHRAD